MNPYDQANLLAKSLKEHEYYKEYMKARQMIEADPASKKIVEDLRLRQMDLERSRLMGKQPTPEQLQAVHRMQEIVKANQKIKTYLEAEYKFGTLMADIQKVIADTLELVSPGTGK